MTIVATEDNRNLEWRKSNVGSALLQKMGWKEGQAIGKRSNANINALRAVRRQEGLGLGAKVANQGGDSAERSDHFASVLSTLKTHHKPASSSKKKKEKEAKSSRSGKKVKLTLAQNRVNAGHARKLREAKFGAKSAEDLACIFGNRDLKVTAVETFKPVDAIVSEEDESENKKREKKAGKKSKKKKRKNAEESD